MTIVYSRTRGQRPEDVGAGFNPPRRVGIEWLLEGQQHTWSALCVQDTPGTYDIFCL